MNKNLIVVFGGTFDPPHNGHLHAARSVGERFKPDRIILMPAATPPHKPVPKASREDRLAMLELLAASDPLLEVSTLELDRQGPSYTYQTVDQLKRLCGPDCGIAWVVGMDMLAELSLWRRARRVVEQARIITVARPPMPERLSDLRDALAGDFGDEKADQLMADILAVEPLDISSTMIRRRRAAGQPIADLVPEAVGNYIMARGLYLDE